MAVRRTLLREIGADFSCMEVTRGEQPVSLPALVLEALAFHVELARSITCFEGTVSK